MLSVKTVFLALLASSAIALPIRREVPQEHSHEQFLTTVRASLNLNNPDAISDPVFGLLGNAAAAAGQGKITNTDCLQQATADQAFTNAKAKSDVAGMTAALIYRALERNTGKVGLASVACTAIKAKNPEIAAITQHQDPASAGAAATNKAITLALAKQIAAVGGDPTLALKSGTFKAGSTSDNTGKGNTCDDANDKTGCIFTQNLIVEDATADEIKAAVAGVSASSSSSADASASSSAASSSADESSSDDSSSDDSSSDASSSDASSSSVASAADSTATCAPPTTVTVTVGGAAATAASTASAASEAVSTAAAASGGNLQTFTGALGGLAPPVTVGGRGFVVSNDGGADFLNKAAALGRSCDVQHNACSNAANTKSQAGLTSVSQCDTQNNACHAAI